MSYNSPTLPKPQAEQPHFAFPTMTDYQFSETVSQNKPSSASVASAMYFVTAIKTIFNMPRNVILGHPAVLPMFKRASRK